MSFDSAQILEIHPSIIGMRGARPMDSDGLPACPDPVMEGFVNLILPPDEASKVMRGFYTDALHSTLLRRLAELREADRSSADRKLNPLPKWRLKKVYEFIDLNLEERISLEDLAQVAGVSRMYFAAQFRAATGMRPHDYLIRRRISAARELLAGSETSIVEIALSVGFQTQSHFTTVFKRTVGLTPFRWRELNFKGAPADKRCASTR